MRRAGALKEHLRDEPKDPRPARAPRWKARGRARWTYEDPPLEHARSSFDHDGRILAVRRQDIPRAFGIAAELVPALVKARLLPTHPALRKTGVVHQMVTLEGLVAYLKWPMKIALAALKRRGLAPLDLGPRTADRPSP